MLLRTDERGNSLVMTISEGLVTLAAGGPDVHASVDTWLIYRNEYSPPASMEGRENSFEVLFAAFASGIEVSDTPYDYEDSRDAGKTWALWERVAQALGFENKEKPYVVY